MHSSLSGRVESSSIPSGRRAVHGLRIESLICFATLSAGLLLLVACAGHKALSTARVRHHDPLQLVFNAATDEVVATLSREDRKSVV